MKKQPITIRLISVCAMAVGLVFMLVGFLGGAKYNVIAGSNGAHIVNSTPHTLKDLTLDAFQSVDLSVSQSNIEFIPSEHYGVDICYYDDTNEQTYTVENGTLKISDAQGSKPQFLWFNMNLSNLQTPNTIKIYLPPDASLKNIKVQSSMGSLKFDRVISENTEIHLDSGSLQMHDTVCGNATIDLHNGSSTMQNVKVKNLSFENAYGKSSFERLTLDSAQDSTIKAQNGEITIKDLTSAGPILLNDTYGSIHVDGMKANSVKSTLQNGNYEILNSEIKDLTIENSMGGIVISKLQSNGLNLKSGNGSITVDGELKGVSTIKSNLGSVNVKTALAQNQYNYDFISSHGGVKINGQKQEENIRQNSGAENSLSISCGNGDIDVNFQP